MKKLSLTVLVCCLLSFAFQLQAERVSKILKSGTTRIGEIVTVEGIVLQHVDAKKNFKDYYLKDNYGDKIMVHTDGFALPITNEKYKIKGYLNYNKDKHQYYISETGRLKLADGDNKTEASVTVPPIEPPKGSINDWIQANTQTVIIVGLCILALILIIIGFIVSKKKQSPSASKPSFTSQMETKPEEKQVKIPVTENIQNNTEDLKTMVIPKADPQTMKFIPGKLEILKGADSGKSFKIAGSPQTDGTSVVSIGREASSETNMFSHIHLKESTISRRQAEIIQSNGNVKIKNLSKTNYTKINGKELLPNEAEVLIPDSIITLGEVEIKYLLN